MEPKKNQQEQQVVQTTVERSEKKYKRIACNFFRIKRDFEQRTKRFGEIKTVFEEAMLEYTDKVGKKKVIFKDDSGLAGIEGSEVLVVNRVEKTSIEWDADKLEKRIDKNVAKQVIKKQYRITNMKGLTEYLKECGVDPKIFKKFISVDKTVDDKAIDRLGDIGALTVKSVSGCYRVKCQKPYFTVSVKKDDSYEGEQ